MADERDDLGQVAVPFAAWWQEQGSDALLRFAFPSGPYEFSYMAPEYID